MKRLDHPDCRSEILARLQRIQPDTPRRWGRMTAPQMICHLRDSFLAVMGEIPVSPSRSFFWRAMKWGALYSPSRWPKGVPTRPELDQAAGAGTPPAQFDADIGSLMATIERFTRTPRDFEPQPHPMFGPMTERQWMRWGYLHTDHHLRQFGA
jgi:hypothetical protein